MSKNTSVTIYSVTSDHLADKSAPDYEEWGGTDVVLESDYAALQSRNAELEKDAARYRYLRVTVGRFYDLDGTEHDCRRMDGKQFDADIDAALSKSPGAA